MPGWTEREISSNLNGSHYIHVDWDRELLVTWDGGKTFDVYSLHSAAHYEHWISESKVFDPKTHIERHLDLAEAKETD